MYHNKIQERGVQNVVNMNKIRLETYGDLTHFGFSQFNKSFINNQDPHSQIKNYE